MEEGQYLMMDPACEVNEKGTREKSDENEVIEEGTSPSLDLDLNEIIEADEGTLPYAKEDWQDPKHIEVPNPYNPDGDKFVVDRIDLKKIVKELVGREENAASQDIDIVDNQDEERSGYVTGLSLRLNSMTSNSNHANKN